MSEQTPLEEWGSTSQAVTSQLLKNVPRLTLTLTKALTSQLLENVLRRVNGIGNSGNIANAKAGLCFEVQVWQRVPRIRGFSVSAPGRGRAGREQGSPSSSLKLPSGNREQGAGSREQEAGSWGAGRDQGIRGSGDQGIRGSGDQGSKGSGDQGSREGAGEPVLVFETSLPTLRDSCQQAQRKALGGADGAIDHGNAPIGAAASNGCDRRAT